MNALAVCGLGVVLPATGALAQWSSNPAANLAIGDRSGEQTQPKIQPTADGGCYISWFDNSTGGYDVYLQRLDAAGVEQWAHNGILIADRSVSSTVDYDLAVDAQGNAIITYNDDTVVAGTQQIQVQKVTPAGQLLWGPQGVTVSDGTNSPKNNPRIVALGDGTYISGFTGANTILLQRLGPDGSLLWPAPLAISELYQAPSTLHNMTLSDLQRGDGDTFIALYVRARTNSFLSNKSLYAQKFSAAGAPLWTGAAASTNAGSPVVVFDAGTTSGVQNGYFPTFIPDGSGGAVFAWYETGGQRHAYIQHTLAQGTPRFPTPISITGETVGRIRIGAAVAYHAQLDSYFAAAPEAPLSTTVADSLVIQRISAAGARLWNEAGIYLLPPGSSQPSFVQCVLSNGIPHYFCITPTATASSAVMAGAVYQTGEIVWTAPLATAPGAKGRLVAAALTPVPQVQSIRFAAVAFTQEAPSGSDVHAQNVSHSGLLGPHCYANCDLSPVPPILNVADFTCFLSRFAAGDLFTNCDFSTQPPVLNVADFTCFLQKFAAGCP